MTLCAEDGGYGRDHLPYGSLTDRTGRRFVAARLGDCAIDLTALSTDEAYAELFADGILDRFLAAGQSTWAAVRSMLTQRITDSSIEASLIPLGETVALMPMTIGDYVDFYASEHHARTVGQVFRPDGDALTANWKHLPIGYHGRAGTIVVSGTDIQRPHGQARDPDGTVRFGPTHRLDFEAEIGFILGHRTPLGQPVTLAQARNYIFGVCLVNDWSARDIQAWEYVPLGPFLGKSFATSMSAWITRPRREIRRCWPTLTTRANRVGWTSRSASPSTAKSSRSRRSPRCTGPHHRCSPT